MSPNRSSRYFTRSLRDAFRGFQTPTSCLAARASPIGITTPLNLPGRGIGRGGERTAKSQDVLKVEVFRHQAIPLSLLVLQRCR